MASGIGHTLLGMQHSDVRHLPFEVIDPVPEIRQSRRGHLTSGRGRQALPSEARHGVGKTRTSREMGCRH